MPSLTRSPGPAADAAPQSPRLAGALAWLVPLMAGLNMLGSFAIDAYLPAFAAMSASLGASSWQMQQTLSAYLLGFGLMSLVVGDLSDRLGRRSVVLAGALFYTVASLGCAMAVTPWQLIGWRAVQGAACSAACVTSIAIVRDLHAPREAQQAITRITMYFVIGPLFAPLLGAWLLAAAGWRAIFMAMAAAAALLLALVAAYLPETLPASQRNAWRVGGMLQGYREVLADRRFLLLTVASTAAMNGAFIYVLAAPAYLGIHLGLEPGQYFPVFALLVVAGVAGCIASTRLAGRVTAERQLAWGFTAMVPLSIVNLAANHLWTAHASWAVFPIAAYAAAWAFAAGPCALLVIDLCPARRGVSAALQAAIVSAINALVAGALVPAVAQSPTTLAWGSVLMTAIGAIAWWQAKRRLATA